MNIKNTYGPVSQTILVFQQKGRGEGKVKGIGKYGRGMFRLEVISVEDILPPVVDNPGDYLPEKIQGDLVLDFLIHPDISHELALLCKGQGVPVVASGKKIRVESAITPPT